MKSFVVALLAVGGIWAGEAKGQYSMPEVLCEIFPDSGREAWYFVSIGDQNGDGCDELAMYQLAGNRWDVFFGGERMHSRADTRLIPIEGQGNEVGHVRLLGRVTRNSDHCFQTFVINREDTTLYLNVYEELGDEPIVTITGKGYYNFGSLWELRNYPCDINGDGFDDILAYRVVEERMYLEVYFGGVEVDSVVDVRIPLPGIARTGYGGCSSGFDLNGDHFDDMILYGQRIRGQDQWDCMTFLGGNPIDTTVDLFYDPDQFTPDPYPIRYGVAGRMVGDVNGDGNGDWVDFWRGVIPAPTPDDHTTIYNGAFLFSGGNRLDSIPDLDSAFTIRHGAPYTSCMAGDFNGDGISDALISRLDDNGQFVSIKLGCRWFANVPDIEIDLRRVYNDSYFFSGTGSPNTMTVGDFNGDGCDDFALASDHHRPPSRLVIFKGRLDWETSVPATTQPVLWQLALSSFPNPFNAVVNLSFQAARPGYYALEMIDPSGRSVARLFDGFAAAGENKVTWNAAGMAAGEYFIRLDGGLGGSTVRSVVLVK